MYSSGGNASFRALADCALGACTCYRSSAASLIDSQLRTWILAAPPLFVLHELEEYRTMLPWIEKHAAIIPAFIRSIIPNTPAFIAYAGVLFVVVFTVAGVIALRSKPLSIAWIVLTILFVARLENAVFHMIESIALMQYTPGVVTAAVLVFPLTFYLIRRFVRDGLIQKAWLPVIIVAGFIVQSAAIGGMLLLG